MREDLIMALAEDITMVMILSILIWHTQYTKLLFYAVIIILNIFPVNSRKNSDFLRQNIALHCVLPPRNFVSFAG